MNNTVSFENKKLNEALEKNEQTCQEYKEAYNQLELKTKNGGKVTDEDAEKIFAAMSNSIEAARETDEALWASGKSNKEKDLGFIKKVIKDAKNNNLKVVE